MATEDQFLTVHVPLKFRKWGGRKQVIAQGDVPSRLRPGPDSTLVKALARAHRWKGMLEGGEYASITELAASEKINQSYLCRVLRLTLLAPDIVESILDGRLADSIQLDELFKPFPNQWDLQRQKFGRN